MELHAVDGKLPVAKSHNLALGRSRVDFQAIGHARWLQQERVIARGLKWIRQSAKNAGAVVMDGRGLAVHQALRADDRAAEDLADALMPEADPKHRPARAKSLD